MCERNPLARFVFTFYRRVQFGFAVTTKIIFLDFKAIEEVMSLTSKYILHCATLPLYLENRKKHQFIEFDNLHTILQFLFFANANHTGVFFPPSFVHLV